LVRATFEPDPAPPTVSGERTALKPRCFLPIVTVKGGSSHEADPCFERGLVGGGLFVLALASCGPNKDYTAYGECMKKYIDDTKLILNTAATAVNGAVEEFNKFAADTKAQDEAAKN
jgi:hypothetical protein